MSGKILDAVLSLNNSSIKDTDPAILTLIDLIIMIKFSDLGLLNNRILNLAGVSCGHAKHINI